MVLWTVDHAGLHIKLCTDCYIFTSLILQLAILFPLEDFRLEYQKAGLENQLWPTALSVKGLVYLDGELKTSVTVV